MNLSRLLIREQTMENNMFRNVEDLALPEPTLQEEALNAMPSCISVVDAAGTIVFMNERWSAFGKANGLELANFREDENYFEVCKAALAPIAKASTAGVRDVLSGSRVEFQLDYPCHSPDEDRWFSMRVRPLPRMPHFALITHDDITEQMKADKYLRQAKRLLSQRLELAEQRLLYTSALLQESEERFLGTKGASLS